MSAPAYPPGTVRALLATPHVSEATRAALQARLDAPAYTPQFLAPEAYALLEAVAARIFPQPNRADQPIALAPAVDQRLAEGRSTAGATMPCRPTVKPTAWAWAVFRKLRRCSFRLISGR